MKSETNLMLMNQMVVLEESLAFASKDMHLHEQPATGQFT